MCRIVFNCVVMYCCLVLPASGHYCDDLISCDYITAEVYVQSVGVCKARFCAMYNDPYCWLFTL